MKFRGTLELSRKTAVRAGAGLIAGDEVEVPPDVAEALRAAGVREAFDKLNYSSQRRHTLSIADAKTGATRQRRIAKAVEDLSG